MLIIKNTNNPNNQQMLPETGQAVRVAAERNTQYQLVDQKGRTIKNPKIKKVGDDLLIFGETNVSDVADFIIEDYYSFLPVDDVATLEALNASFATAGEGFVAPLVAETSLAALGGSLGLGQLAIGAAGLVGAVVAVSGGGGDTKPSQSQQTPTTTTPPKPVVTADITIDAVPTINKAKAMESVTISGSLSTSANVTSSEVVVTVNGKDYKALIKGNVWTANIKGADLAYAQGTNSIVAKVTAKGGQNQTVTDIAKADYHVDTHIAKPQIIFDKITGDDIINSVEAKSKTTKITGSVKNVNDGDEIILTIGNAKAVAKVAAGKFTIDVDTIALITHKIVNASISTKDKAGNGDTGMANHVITTSEAPGIIINNVTNDNIVNMSEANNPNGVTITGTVGQDWRGKQITVSCGCPSCTGKGWKDIVTLVKNDGTFEVNFAGDVIADNTTIKVTANENGASIIKQKDYEKDLAAPKHSLVIDGIAKDDIINSQEVNLAKTKITAKVTGINSDETVSAAFLTVAGKKIPATITKGVLSAEVDTALLKTVGEVSASVTVVDKAGNSSTKTATRSYSVDAEHGVSVSIDGVNHGKVINASTAKTGITLAGKLNIAPDTDLGSVKVVVSVNGVQHNAVVDTASKTWQLPLSASQLKEGGNSVVATISASDKAGNTATHTSSTKNYTVDTKAEVKISLEQITGDNIIQNSEKTSETTIKGKVTGDFKPADKVLITAGALRFEVGLDGKGNFSQTVAVADLLKQNGLTVKAEISTTDNAGNLAKGEASQTYRIADLSADQTKIEITKIANDNLVNVTEATGQVAIIGKVSGGNIKQGDTVKVAINGKTYDGLVDDQLNFKAIVNGQELLNNAGYKVTASINGVTSNEVAYRVDANAVASIRINNIAGDDVIDINESNPLIRLSGKLNLMGDWLEGKNAKYIYAINTQIGSKTYVTGVDDDNQTFFFDIPASELASMAGKKLDFKVVHSDNVVYYEDWGKEFAGWQRTAPKLTNANVVLNRNDHISGQTGDYTVNEAMLKNHSKVNIVGEVGGNAKVGDVVSLTVGTKTYTGQVNANNKFDILVEKSDINHQPIIVKLATKDLSGKTIEVSDTALVAIAKEGNAAMTSQHDKVATANLPYFIKSLNIEASFDAMYGENKYSSGFLTKDNMKIAKVTENGANLTYSFDNLYSTINKTVVKSALATISKYTTLTFTEVANTQKADIKYLIASMNPGTLGYAGAGGDVTISKEAYYDDNKNLDSLYGFVTAIHETLHALGAAHPFEGNFGSGITKSGLLGKDSILAAYEDSLNFSTLSYNTDDANLSRDLRLYDLAYLHYRFGVDTKERAGNDVYTFKNFNAKSSDGDIYIWDGNGVDTFDASKESEQVYVDLMPGSWIYRGTKSTTLASSDFASKNLRDFFNLPDGKGLKNDVVEHRFNEEDIIRPYDYTDGQAFIGYDTQIENLVGGRGNDTLLGNKAGNAIYGGEGNDTIDAREGDDYLDGGAGADKLTGGVGNDIYVIDNKGDVVTELKGGGKDLVYSTINYTLANEVEDLVLLGNVANEAIGNALANTLRANNIGATIKGMAGNDTLIGGIGADRLDGGTGADVYVFNTALNGTLDTLIMDNQDVIQLDDAIFKGLTSSNIATHIKYDKNTKVLSYDEDGAGHIDMIAFARVEGDFNFDVSKFIII